MGASLAAGVAAARQADGWVVALGDMPWIGAGTVASVADTVRDGALLAAPCYGGRGGHPVGFGARLGRELLGLDGDAGGRMVVAANRSHLVRVAVSDPGVLRDVDTPGDLPQGSGAGSS